MPRRYLLAAALLLPTAAVRADDKTAAGEFFEKSVRPLLSEHCFDCHGPAKQKAGLRLDSKQAMLLGGDTGSALVPGNPAASLLVKALHYKDDLRMPPKAPLKAEQIAIVTKWVKDGAEWPGTNVEIRTPTKAEFEITARDREFWSFKPIANPPVPKVRDAKWAQKPIDHFILAKLESLKLQPVEPADRRSLIRRATFDLIGLPPTPEEIDAFLKDQSPDAFAKVIDRLLASPHYGERWARHWLDVARYAEDQAHTFQARRYPQGFRYRDWLIKAFNDDMPYDQFIKEQLAADLLGKPAERLEHLPALGFFALGPVYYGDPKRLDQIDDRIDTLTRGLLGLTVACARCHDHKYDPISAKDYYGLAGIIASTDYVELSLMKGSEGQPVPPPSKDKNAPPPAKEFIHALKEGTPTTMKVHLRGNPATLGDNAPRRMMTILSAEAEPAFTLGSGRLDLANAIASDKNPLTARVLVNRIWQHHFGKGLVRTPSNFGALGEPPTHPELLDHLASKFIASGWSIKAIHREVMLSATYQLSTQASEKAEEIDADNKYLWQANRRRLEVEAWRDAMLAVADKLDRTIGGPSGDLANADNRRRTLYGLVSRNELNPLLRLFDFPDPNITSDERTTTTVPLQQLFVLNSDFLVNNAKALAANLHKVAKDDNERVRLAFETLYGRPATEREVALGVGYVSQKSAGTLTRWEQYAQVLLSTNEFLYVD